MRFRSLLSGGAPRVRRRALIGTAVLAVLVTVAGLVAFLTREDRDGTNLSAPTPTSAAPSPSPVGSPASESRAALPVPPDTRDPIVFGKAAAVALWSYDSRASSQPELLDALHRWISGEERYADTESVDRQIPDAVLWSRMADNGQYATAVANEGHFPASFTQALQADPGAITQAYVYAVTVSGKQSIAWNGSPTGGGEDRAITLAVQCRPDKPCALVGVLPTVSP